MRKFLLIPLFCFLWATQIAWGLEVPKLEARVTDLARLLTPAQKTEIETMLQAGETQTSTQFALLTVPSLEGEALEDFSMRVAEKWRLGQKGLDNGVLLIVAIQERKVRIEVGYGLETLLTDAKTGFIIRNAIVPRFKNRDYYAGIKEGLAMLTGIVNRQFDISPEQLAQYQKTRNKPQGKQVSIAMIIFIFIGALLLFRGGRSRGLLGGLLLGSMLGGSSHRSSGSGLGGGGFGGFSGGGGGFGGGGSSGSW